MYYQLIRKLLFALNPELSHGIALKALKLAHRLHLTPVIPRINIEPCTKMGLLFPNKVGLAAGLDKNGDYIDALGALGFGFIEIGTVTPTAQAGNPPPRIWRIQAEQAIINRLGFNNKGVDYLVNNLRNTKFKGVIGVNIGKNATTPLEQAVDDYLYCFKQVAPLASYITVNISSPNTQALRNLQTGELLEQLLAALKDAQDSNTAAHGKYLPLIVKIAPDLSFNELSNIAQAITKYKIDGVIATNTTIKRSMIAQQFAQHAGGLSGKPLYYRATSVLKCLRRLLPNTTIIASGGVNSIAHGVGKITAGADLVQVYTGLVYGGPAWLHDLITAIAALR